MIKYLYRKDTLNSLKRGGNNDTFFLHTVQENRQLFVTRLSDIQTLISGTGSKDMIFEEI